MNIRDKLLSVLATKSHPFEFEGVTDLVVRELTVGESDELAKLAKSEDPKVKQNFAAEMIVRSLFDVDGQPVLTMDDVEALRESSSKKFEDLFLRIIKIQQPEKGEDEKK